MDVRPKQLAISIGGFMGSSYSIVLSSNGLEYETQDTGYTNSRTEMIAPTPEQWAKFRATLDSIRVWKWKESYPNPGVCDGTNWGVEIAYDDVQMRSCGDNNYPKPRQGFDRLMKAVQALIGGRDFE